MEPTKLAYFANEKKIGEQILIQAQLIISMILIQAQLIIPMISFFYNQSIINCLHKKVLPNIVTDSQILETSINYLQKKTD